MKRLLIIFILLSLFSFQSDQFLFNKSIPTNATHLTIDNLSNVYLSNNDVLIKCNSQGVQVKSYSNKTLGSITVVDASNPMKLLLFYSNFLQIVFLDNTLSQNGDPVSLEALGFPRAQLVCSSHNNGLWIYNQQNFELIRFDEDLNIASQTGNLSQQIGIELKPNFMVQYNNRLYVNNPLTGILVFDIFGTYFKTIPIQDISDFQFKEDEIIYYLNGHLNTFNMQTLQQSRSELSDSFAISVKLARNNLYVLHKDTFKIYSIK